MGRSKRVAVATVVAIVTTAVCWWIARAGWLDPLEWTTWSLRARAFAEVTDANIRLILIDDTSLSWAKEDSGRERWPRDYNVAVISFLSKAGTKALVFADDSTKADSGRNDEHMAEAMASSGPLAIGLATAFSKLGHAEQEWPVIRGSLLEVDGLPEAWMTSRDSPIRMGTADFPIDILAESADLLGSLVDVSDADQAVRRLQPLQLYQGQVVLALGFLPFALSNEGLPDLVEGGLIRRELPALVLQDDLLRFGEKHSVPLDATASVTLRYRKADPAWGSFRYPTLSACAAVVAGREIMFPRETGRKVLSADDQAKCPAVIDIDPNDFKDSYVFFGRSKETATPVGSATGLEIHATALDNLLTGDFIRRGSAWHTVPFTLTLTFLGAYTTLSSRKRWQVTMAFVACMVASWLVGWWAYPRGTWWPIAMPLVATFAACALGAGLRYAQLRTLAWMPGRAARSAARSAGSEFDVFLSHNSKNKPVVRELADALEARGIRVWLDERELIPGRPWQDALEEIIRDARSAAILVGADGLGPWEIAEMRGCLSQFVDRGAPVIPVLLPGAPAEPDLPLFLKQLTWVDLRSGLPAEGLDRLQWGITGVKPGS